MFPNWKGVTFSCLSAPCSQALDLNLDEGRHDWLDWHNGSGKSTLIKTASLRTQARAPARFAA